jgi:hypothetical protein
VFRGPVGFGHAQVVGRRGAGPDEPFEPFSPAMLAARVREVCDRVGAHARGRPHQEVRAELEEAFREIDQWMPPAELDLMARSMADPWWAIKHPVEAARVRRVLEAEDTDVDDDEDSVSQLVERFDDGPRWWGRRSARVVGVAQRRTFDGWAYQVSISPWSDRLAHEIRKRCAGYDVGVVEHATRELFGSRWHRRLRVSSRRADSPWQNSLSPATTRPTATSTTAGHRRMRWPSSLCFAAWHLSWSGHRRIRSGWPNPLAVDHQWEAAAK